MLYKIFHQNIFEIIDLSSAMFMTASVLVVGYVWTCMRASRRQKMLELENTPHRVLLITAHPDDECMFFGPVIQKLSKMKDVHLFLMCLSVGDFEGKGSLRKAELYDSCKILGIEEGNILLCKNTLLPDNPSVDWDTILLADKIAEHVEQLEIDTVLTFDSYGVSGHRNHISIYLALFHLVYNKLLPSYCHLYSLDSVNTLRKYVKYIDVLFNNTSDFKCTISTTEQHCVTVSNYFLYTAVYLVFLYLCFRKQCKHTILSTFGSENCI
uniref:N-acetylglucosaminylphosphatidylinositol deacetylase n=1 Tax=Melanaphis sacchari TaxID=742174 RepID=A0A2H8THC7_9HEMI